MFLLCSKLILWICAILTNTRASSIGMKKDKIVDYFIYTPTIENQGSVQQWEFFVVGRRVPWNEAHAICPVYNDHRSFFKMFDPSPNDFNESNTDEGIPTMEENEMGSHLATLNEEMKDWLARMLSESDYRYDGLWIGGQRKNLSSNWTWIDGGKEKDSLISDALVKQSYPDWYKADAATEFEKNCLIFDRIGHDVPTFIPENCRSRKPFLCMKPGKLKKPEKISEGTSVSVDGRRYTLYQVIDEEDEEDLKLAGVRKLNGGGIKWREAKLECQKRGQYFAMVFTNEAAEAIAKAMLKSRPSIESAWLGGWSADGTEWMWVSTGFNLPSEKSPVTSYPPWLEGHPLPQVKDHDYYQRRGRCLIVDRHLCPEQRHPVFLDLDCERKRPFVCQDSIPVRRAGLEPEDRSISMSGKILIFSEDTMSWHEGQQYCLQKSGRIASILDTKTLSMVLEKMAQLGLDHTWVGAHTKKTDEGWKWLDENNQVLRENAVALNSSWCLEKDGGSFRADDETCLNLDREGHSLPLFYGLPCNSSEQYVLCTLTVEEKTISSENVGNDETSEEDVLLDALEQPWNREIVEPAFDSFQKRDTYDTKHVLIVSNILDYLQELSTALTTRIGKVASFNQSGLLFVMDDSLSVLNSWFAEELKLAAAMISHLYPLSPQRRMGLITFSKRPKVALNLTQQDPCVVLSFLSTELLANRSTYKGNDTEDLAAKTTDIINAALMAADVVQKANFSKVATIFITDGEHVKEEDNEKQLLSAVEKLNDLRKNGHDVIGVIVSQGENTTANYQVVESLFNDTADGNKNLYFVKSYEDLAVVSTNLISSANGTNYAANCSETQWVVPEDNELLKHLLRFKRRATFAK